MMRAAFIFEQLFTLDNTLIYNNLKPIFDPAFYLQKQLILHVSNRAKFAYLDVLLGHVLSLS